MGKKNLFKNSCLVNKGKKRYILVSFCKNYRDSLNVYFEESCKKCRFFYSIDSVANSKLNRSLTLNSFKSKQNS